MDASISGLVSSEPRRIQEKRVTLHPEPETRRNTGGILGAEAVDVDANSANLVDNYLRETVVAQNGEASSETQVIIFSRSLEHLGRLSPRDEKFVEEGRILADEYESMERSQLLMVEGDVAIFLEATYTRVRQDNQEVEFDLEELTFVCVQDIETHGAIQKPTKERFVALGFDLDTLGESLKILTRLRKRLANTDPVAAAELADEEVAAQKAYVAAADDFVYLATEYEDLAAALDPEIIDSVIASCAMFMQVIYAYTTTNTTSLDDLQTLSSPLGLLGNILLLTNDPRIKEIIEYILEKIIELREMVLDELAKMHEEQAELDKIAEEKRIKAQMEKLQILLKKLRADKLKLDVLLAKINSSTTTISPEIRQKAQRAVRLNQEAIEEAERQLAVLQEALQKLEASESAARAQ